MSALRIAVGQISAESNHFVPSGCGLGFFRATGYLHEGDALLKLDGSDTEIGGILDACQKDGNVEIVPLIAARGNSSGPLARDAWAWLRAEMLKRLRTAGPVDGVVLSCHGSLAAENEDDPEGDLAEAVRVIVGPGVPVAMTLDLHGNVTRRMVEKTDLIVGYEHYPHDDAKQTGARATSLLLRTIRHKIKPVMARANLPMLLTAFNASTSGEGPYARLMRHAKDLEHQPGILSTSVFLVGSYLDVPEIGCTTLVIADGDAELAEFHAKRLAKEFWSLRKEFITETISVSEAVKRGRQIEGGPVLLLDAADTTGGGAAGDGIGLVRGLIKMDVTERCLAMVVDPEAVRACNDRRIGDKVTLEVGHKLAPMWGKPLKISGVLQSKIDGKFRYAGGILGGTSASMGSSVVIAIGNLQLLIMTRPTYDWAYEQYTAAGMDPRQAKFVGVKNMMNFRFGYNDLMKGFFVLDLPGPTPMDMRALPFKHIPRPMYPFDEFSERPTDDRSASRNPRLRTHGVLGSFKHGHES